VPRFHSKRKNLNRKSITTKTTDFFYIIGDKKYKIGDILVDINSSFDVGRNRKIANVRQPINSKRTRGTYDIEHLKSNIRF